MAVNKKYNKALGKTVNVYPSRQNEGGTEKDITDGSFEGNYISPKFETANTYFEIDLGDT